MCTVTWLQHDHGYEVFCNRDELHTRKPALPPRLHERNGVCALAPVDAEAGGSWIGVNEFGVALCLVNHYPHNIPPLRGVRGVSSRVREDAHKSSNTPLKGEIDGAKKYRSRGLLLTELLDCASLEIIAARLEREKLEQYPPFMLLAFGLHAPFRLLRWDEKKLRHKRLLATDLPVTSSSFETESVIASRRRVFNQNLSEEQTITPEVLARFHRSHEPERSAYSVCMHRADAASVSLTHVRVNRAHAELRYSPHAPCLESKPESFHLQLNLKNALLVESDQALARENAEIIAESIAAQVMAMESQHG